MYQLVRGTRIGTIDAAFFDQMNGDTKIVQGDPVLQIAVEAVSLLHQDRPAHAPMPLQIEQHRRELRTAAHPGRFDINEFLRDDKPAAGGILPQEAKLRWDAEAFLLVLVGNPRVQYHLGSWLHRAASGRSRHG
ncbi:MAG TPA: hypothetical protein VLE22_22980 [Bryobacteraceae bacterium]|nr:hypothetical protein [Bryobacteraceae bacterium]